MRADTPVARGRAPLCACGCGYHVSTIHTRYILGHRPRTSEADRFWGRVDIGGDAECWPWTGYLYPNGYAAFNRRRAGAGGYRKAMAHRVAYELTTGDPVPSDLTIDHLCGNRACMNVSHMEVVTRGENARRGEGWTVSAANRSARAAVACAHGHLRAKYGMRERITGAWRCRECRRLYAARVRRRKRTTA